MKKAIVFRPNSPKMFAVYGGLALVCVWLLLNGTLDAIGIVVCIGFLYTVAAFNMYFFRLEFSDKAIVGPSSFGPMVRVSIPWDNARYKILRQKYGPRCLYIESAKNGRKIKVAEGNFAKNTFQEILDLLSRHCGTSHSANPKSAS